VELDLSPLVGVRPSPKAIQTGTESAGGEASWALLMRGRRGEIEQGGGL